MDAAKTSLQVAREQINSCATLSQEGRREDGLAAVAAAQQTLQRLLGEARNLSGQREVQWLVQEIHVLQIASLLAQAIEVEQSRPLEKGGEGEAVNGREHERRAFAFYAEAKKLAETALPASHSMVALTRRLWSERAVCVLSPAPRDEGSIGQGLSKQLQREGKVETMSSWQPGGAVVQGSSWKSQYAFSPGRRIAAADSGGASVTPSLTRSASTGSGSRGQLDRGARAASGNKSTSSLHRRGRHDSISSAAGSVSNLSANQSKQSRNIFAEYLAEEKMALAIRRGLFNNRQEDLRKQVQEKTRFARLANVGKNVAELANTKFRSTGHAIQMKAYLKDNVSRSEQSLLNEAKTAGTAPEVVLARQLRQAMEPKVEKRTVEKPPDPKEQIFKDSFGKQLGNVFGGLLAEQKRRVSIVGPMAEP